jgi:hypothetical protein
MLGGVGADLDLLPTLRVTFNLNSLFFENTAVLAALRAQVLNSRYIGEDASVAVTYRPLMSQNIVVRAAYAKLFASGATNELFPRANPDYFLLNAILAY